MSILGLGLGATERDMVAQEMYAQRAGEPQQKLEQRPQFYWVARELSESEKIRRWQERQAYGFARGELSLQEPEK